LWNQPEGIVTARGHMLLLVEIGKEQYIADVGFGGLTLTAPLQLKSGVEQQTPHEYFRLTASSTDYILEAKVQGMWKRIYSFGLQENFLPDYEVTSWYLSNHPTSHFVTGLIAAVPFEKGRHTLRNIDFATHYLDGSHERKRFEEVSQLRDVLQNTFGIALPDTPSIDESFDALIQKSLKK
jgi:N-hydroxyarylamine O-acetyltransferase